jgi:hypothetical protein
VPISIFPLFFVSSSFPAPLWLRHTNTPCLLKGNTKLSFYDAAMTKVTRKHSKRIEKPLSLFLAANQQKQFKTPRA